ncbi:MAG: peptidoglycan-binding protein [Clostridium sp.]|uniref:peptidoglycan-binding domain-containing protein n=1 Tax=Clostridium sp. TaxID=1506 RepID=UPI003F2E4EEE
MDTNSSTNKTSLLKIHCFIKGTYVPISNCKVIILQSDRNFNNGSRVFKGFTNNEGFIDNISLSAPDISLSFKPNSLPYGIYTIGISKAGYNNLIIKGVQIFPNVKSCQCCPLTKTSTKPITETITIDEHKQVTGSNSKKQNAISKNDKYYCDPNVIATLIKKNQKNTKNKRILNKVVVPATITVHAGSPYDSSAPNYTLPFVDYIKNVASSELYSTWNSSCLMANIYCIVSFVLNRIYTEWYPSHGDNFDITNDTAYDQAFVYGRTTYSSIDTIVDKQFSSFIQIQNTNYPMFAEFCNGTSVTCPGWLSQWGSQYLAQQGYYPYEILTYYYGSDINLVVAPDVADDPRSYPGRPLIIGSTGPNVVKKQKQINRIAQNFPLIPTLATDGIFGPLTSNSVKVYQGVFNLPQTGIIDYATWYSMSRVYTSVMNYNELNS